MSRRRALTSTAVLLAILLVAGVVVLVRQVVLRPMTINAYFTSTAGIYPGDDVRVAGIKVGSIDSIEPMGTRSRVTMQVDHGVPIPADARAILVAPNLVAARYVQLAPAYEDSGPKMADGADIPNDRTAVPVEWDDVKTQLMRLATELGPGTDLSTSSVGRFIDSAANAMGGNGDKLRETISQLAGVGRILADGSGNIVDTIRNLQAFVSALRDSGEQIVTFQGRLATLSEMLDDNRSDLDAALTDLSVAVGDIQDFVAGARDATSEQVQRLANVTQILVDKKMVLKNILHTAPNAFANGYNIYNPDTGAVSGQFVFNNFTNPVQFICSAIGGLENVTAPESAKLCAQYLGPALKLLNFNFQPLNFNPYLRKSASPENIIYSDPKLAPGGSGAAPVPPEEGPAVSAYTGMGDVPPPPGYGAPPAIGPGPTAPDHLPAAPSPALYPGAPAPGPSTVSGMLLPAEGPTP
ncbi:MCE family protein [Mycobacterium sp. CVI_P3]|uniref:MCE family protein n=1 Tax=Mycobacterium pinniadriaticum TaxID=2994102 RepID=A0ABT3SPA3_9MYCO|nr:MCE family protein [Mycobacterium pinniadriaticum]MCX2934551.1 MCE family protein [Mycobacterium pinniadriaticum]MCX2940974.1 MCE family protein [Mycobacterium pinniadriaticum]